MCSEASIDLGVTMLKPVSFAYMCLLQVLEHYPHITTKIYTTLLLIVESELARTEENDVVRNGQVGVCQTLTFAPVTKRSS